MAALDCGRSLENLLLEEGVRRIKSLRSEDSDEGAKVHQGGARPGHEGHDRADTVYLYNHFPACPSLFRTVLPLLQNRSI